MHFHRLLEYNLLPILVICICVSLFSCEAGEPSAVIDEDKPEPEISWKWELLKSPTTEHIRGLAVVNDSVVWISGTRGCVYLTTNGGASWDNLSIPGAENFDFRDIHAESETDAWVMSSGDGVRIYGTHDAGMSWEEQYVDDNPEVFFDGLAFWNQYEGLAYGDPVGGRMALLRTNTGWKWHPGGENLPLALEGEAGYAASGTGIVVRENNVWIATGGGEVSRVIHSSDSGTTWHAHKTPLATGEGCGIFSLAFADNENGVALGGCYLDSLNSFGNSAWSDDGGVSWYAPDTPPSGYRSCAAFSRDGSLGVAVGRSGCEWTSDKGHNWTPFSSEGFWVCQFGDQVVWATGRRGKLGRLVTN